MDLFGVSDRIFCYIPDHYFTEFTMSQSLKDLLQQREALEKAIAEARQNEISAAVAQVRAIVAEYGLTAQDVFPGRAGKAAGAKAAGAKAGGGKVAAKYRDPATGQTWTGRGKAPKWIDGKSREQFLIA